MLNATIKMSPIRTTFSEILIPTIPPHKVHMAARYKSRPFPSLLSAQIAPRCALITSLEIANPSPVPPCALARALSTR